jgi:hypothetical protein
MLCTVSTLLASVASLAVISASFVASCSGSSVSIVALSSAAGCSARNVSTPFSVCTVCICLHTVTCTASRRTSNCTCADNSCSKQSALRNCNRQWNARRNTFDSSHSPTAKTNLPKSLEAARLQLICAALQFPALSYCSYFFQLSSLS